MSKKTIDLEHESIKKQITKLDINLQKRPTFTAILTVAGIGITILSGLFYFFSAQLLDTQSKYINASTKNIVHTAIDKHVDSENISWIAKKNQIIKEILARVLLAKK